MRCFLQFRPLESNRVAPGQNHRNHLLKQLAGRDPDGYLQLANELEPVALQRGVLLESDSGDRAEFAYFVETGIVSLVGATRAGQSVEVAIVGREGMAGIAAVLGQRPLPYRLLVQLPGMAFRVPTRVIRSHIVSCTALHELLLGHAQLLTYQLAQSAICNRFHTSVQRLARWLLMTAERAEATRLPLTHEVVAHMVGAPRSAVSQAAASLRRRGIIDYTRGTIMIRNAKRLRRAACECYETLAGAERVRA